MGGIEYTMPFRFHAWFGIKCVLRRACLGKLGADGCLRVGEKEGLLNSPLVLLKL